jgi:hypothetical protein
MTTDQANRLAVVHYADPRHPGGLCSPKGLIRGWLTEESTRVTCVTCQRRMTLHAAKVGHE